jgi:membrane protease subunit HflC
MKFRDGSIPEAENLLRGVIRNTKGEVAGRHVFADFISADPRQMKFGQIEQEILTEMQKRVNDLHYGVEIKFLQIQKIGLPESVTQNVITRMSAERQVHIDNITSEGDLRSTEIKSTADGQALNLLADAEARSVTIRGEGEAQMMKSLEVLQQNPSLAAFNLQIAAMEDFLKKKTTLILDTSTSPLEWLQMAQPAKPDK